MSYLQVSKAGTRGGEDFHARMGAIGMQTRCVNCYTKTGARIIISVYVNEGYTLYHVAFVRLMTVLLFFYTHCSSFEMIDRFGTNYC